MQQLAQAYVDHQPPNVGYRVAPPGQRVAGLRHAETVYAEVEREHERHAAYADVHARGPRGGLHNLLHRPVLHGRNVEQGRQHNKQDDGGKQYAEYPQQGLLHLFNT